MSRKESLTLEEIILTNDDDDDDDDNEEKKVENKSYTYGMKPEQHKKEKVGNDGDEEEQEQQQNDQKQETKNKGDKNDVEGDSSFKALSDRLASSFSHMLWNSKRNEMVTI
uniref:Uncharacterized protein n=1 Tax=Cyclophora tenuis TaxID=216820 RepID=A0A7S1D744_CYCTE